MSDILGRMSDAEALGAQLDLGTRVAEAYARRRTNGRPIVEGLRSEDFDEALRAAWDTASTAGSLMGVWQPRGAAPLQRRLFLRDLIPTVPMTTHATPFFRELAPLDTEGGASGVAEGATKPNVAGDLNFEPLLATAGTLAADLEDVSEVLLKDAPSFAAYINQRLPYMLRVAEERAALRGHGDPVDAGITGLLVDPDVPKTTLIGATVPEAVGQALAAASEGGSEPDAVVLRGSDVFSTIGANPDWWLAPAPSPWLQELAETGVRVVRSESIPHGYILAGNFAAGAVLLDRNKSSVEVFDQHADYVRTGRVLVRAEERIAFVVTNPTSFRVVKSNLAEAV